MYVSKRKKSISWWLFGGGVCIASLFIVIICLFIGYKSNTHTMHYREHRATHHVRERVELDMWQIERRFVQRQVQYLAELYTVQSQAQGMLTQYHQEVMNWGRAHRYYDGYNGQTYMPDYEYSQNEDAGLDSTDAIKSAHTIKDYQALIRLIAASTAHLQAMKVDSGDKTLWYQAHATDLQLIKYYHLSGQVVVVSFIEQVVRVYQDGKLVKAFLVTSGRFGDPSPVGMWHISRRRWHTVFRSRVPVGSPNWYPDTPINYAMEYRTGGYYLHDSWWRTYYGPGTEFPHYDPAGQEFAGTGSHGCINLAEGAAAWLYANTDYDTAVITY
jgi:hypothetical protein